MLGSLVLGRVSFNKPVPDNSLLTCARPQGYSSANFNETEHGVLRDLSDYGLVFLPSVS